MGKRIRVQRRGRGGSTFQSSTHKRTAPSLYPVSMVSEEYENRSVNGNVQEILHDAGRGTPLAFIRFENGETCYTVIPEGIHVGQQIQLGGTASIEVGNIIPMGKIPEGTMICNIELRPGDGGKMAKSSGSYAVIVGHTSQGTMIKLPSGKTKYLADRCRATIGLIAGSGRTDKPFLKAGQVFHLMRARGRKYPRTSGRKMVAAVHPYGSSKRSSRKVTTTSHGAPPGQKVGLIAARRAGQGRQRKAENT